jgi:hypothetical protein
VVAWDKFSVPSVRQSPLVFAKPPSGSHLAEVMLEVVHLLGFVNAAPEFKDHLKIINGCFDL